MQHIKYIFLSLLVSLFATAAMAQSTVQGTVVDETGEPVIGASVMVKGSTQGVITDYDGNFKLDVPKGAQVDISYIGYITQTIKAGFNGKVQLKEDKQNLEEVVVVGYAVQKKAHLTGSVATVDTGEIQDLAVGGLASSLSGLVNGLSVSGGDARPGENARLSIRDTNSIGAVGSTAQQPLFVIDGYVYPNDVKMGEITTNPGADAFNNLDASEIESISVLKDASAAVYGSRAANGVILVTTKKGKKGAPSISYSGTFGFTDEVSRPKMLSTYDYGRLYNAITAADPTNTSLNKTTALFQADELQAMKNLNYDLLDKYWETGTTMKHSVNVSGATDVVNYFAGIAYFDQSGNLGKLDYDRWNYRAGIDVKISKWFSANLTVSGDYSNKTTPLIKVGGSGTEDYNMLLTHPGYIPENVNGYGIPSYGVSNQQKNQRQNYNFAILQNNGDYNNDMTSNITINGGLTYDFGWCKPLKGLTARFSYAKSINTSKGNQFGSNFTLYQMTKRYGSGQHLYTPTGEEKEGFDYLAESNFNPLTLNNGNKLYRTMLRSDNYQVNFTLNYARDFGKHHVGALFSVEKSESESEYLQGQRQDPYEWVDGTYSYSDATGDRSTKFNRAESGTLSYIGRLNYAYDNKYLFEFLLRSDASTKFAPENYWGTFPALSAGWVMSEENWFQQSKLSKIFNYFKLRASWGLTGRDNLAPWQWMQVYAKDPNRGIIFSEDISTDSGTRITINKKNSDVNRDVHWDKSYKTNLGLDFQVLNGRLGVGLEYYYVKNREMLINLSRDVPATIGTQSASNNVGEMNSWGWELSLTWRDKIGKDFKYRIGLNTGYSDNEVLVADFAKEYLYRQITRGHRTDIGVWGMQCIGMFRSFQDIEEYFDRYLKREDGTYGTYMNMPKDKVRPGMLIYKDVRGPQQPDGTYAGPDGIVDKDNDQVCLSNRSNPYGFTTNLNAEWKGFSFTAQFSASWGGYTVVPSQALNPSSNSGNIEYTNMPSFWNPDNMFVYQDIYDGQDRLTVAQNRDAKYPNLAYASVNSMPSTFWRVSAARVSLNRITLAYTLKWDMLKKIGVKSARFNVTGQNLINFYNPYPDHFMNPMAGSYGTYPNLRKWTVGVNLSF